MYNSKSFNGNTPKKFEKVDTLLADQDNVKNLGTIIGNGVDRFWAKRGMIDPSKKIRGFARINK